MTAEQTSSSELRDLPVVSPPDPVPVYDCHVILSGPDAHGRLTGRVTTLPGLQAAAASERALLTELVRQFKQVLVDCRTAGRPVPWIAHPDAPRGDERQRWIPVHL